MIQDVIVLSALAILLIVLIWLLIQVFRAARIQRQWSTGWAKMATRHGMTLNSGATRSLLTGMYQGRILQIIGTYRSGIGIQIATNNYANNNLLMKSRGVAKRPLEEFEEFFERGFSIESRNPEFAIKLFANPALRKRLAPLASVAGLTITLSGEELSLTSSRLIYDPDELTSYLVVLSELATAIEAIKPLPIIHAPGIPIGS